MERLLQFQDTVPCKVRAKRGCATHPRSIAERVNLSLFQNCYSLIEKDTFVLKILWKVKQEWIDLITIWILILQVRRTRISERMRKLQDLVPNMDKVNFLHFSDLSFYVGVVNLWRDLRGKEKMKWKLVFALCLFCYLDLSLPFHSQIQDSNKALIFFCVKSILLL